MAGSQPQSHGNAINTENNLQLLRLSVFTNSNNNSNNYYSNSNKNKYATATTVLHKWKSKLWRRRFRWDQSYRNSFVKENRQLFETIKSNKKDHDIVMFINEMQQCPCIWNRSLRSYHEQIIEKNTWDGLSKEFRCPGKELFIL